MEKTKQVIDKEISMTNKKNLEEELKERTELRCLLMRFEIVPREVVDLIMASKYKEAHRMLLTAW